MATDRRRGRRGRGGYRCASRLRPPLPRATSKTGDCRCGWRELAEPATNLIRVSCENRRRAADVGRRSSNGMPKEGGTEAARLRLQGRGTAARNRQLDAVAVRGPRNDEAPRAGDNTRTPRRATFPSSPCNFVTVAPRGWARVLPAVPLPAAWCRSRVAPAHLRSDTRRRPRRARRLSRPRARRPRPPFPRASRCAKPHTGTSSDGLGLRQPA